MQAIQIQQFGGPEVLELHEIPQPIAGVGELLLRVHAAAINPVDTSVRAGRAGGLSGAGIPYVPGFDVSGVVSAVGPGVTGFNIGDEVFAMLDLRRGGGYAEYAIVKESEAALKPTNTSHEEAASIPLVALTAWQTLFEIADLQAGQTVLIHAGAGGVGSVAVQLAKWKGARVIATASEYNHDFLRGIGVDVTVDYRTQRFEDFAQDVDVVLDPIGGETQVRSLAILKQGGTLVSIVGLTPEGRNPDRSDINVISTLVQPSSSQLAEIAQLIEQGVIRPIVNYRFPLQDAKLAHEQSETRRSRGKIVLQIE
ncbi:MAG: NADP-dependent oxidoreductase [Gammaproteobacteria bacterium]|jgi:NADPH:quinone reductase-like Zn-dependent oxidoreductase|nr:NADP-dependent oxidoreductase [Gammaproteobacteria bacterium]MBT3860232.1 NADP-dependent oxidoreductase [Gammaproteobacteria bacterium]MBT3987524.1 NADP-dependent oxidoreductase [Gammaproteobacteria bacterium]MBT4256289.1 NADP-dependent oxidoreductase [Gammaproteobacteria bacterium]MBT4581738.1 NADP-dependent oxidoreductase [Gammaproteobacteria bacterium]